MHHSLTATLLLTALLTLTNLSTVQSAEVVNGIAAVVNGKVITYTEVRAGVAAQENILRMTERKSPQLLNKKIAELRAEALQDLIDRELILAAFEERGGTIRAQYIDDDINRIVREQFEGDRKAFNVELAKTGMSMSQFKELREKTMIVQAMRGSQTRGLAPASPNEINSAYQKHKSDYRSEDYLKFSTITIPMFATGSTDAAQKALAEEIHQKLKSGANFAATARSYSQDSKADQGGDWGWVERDAILKSMGDAAFKLKSGQISPILEESGSYIILYLDGKKWGETPPKEELRPTLEKLIAQEKGKDIYDQWIKRLREKAVIRKFQ